MKTAEEKQRTRDARNERRRARAAEVKEAVPSVENIDEPDGGNPELVRIETIPLGGSFTLGGKPFVINSIDERKHRVYAQCSDGRVIIDFGNKVIQN